MTRHHWLQVCIPCQNQSPACLSNWDELVVNLTHILHNLSSGNNSRSTSDSKRIKFYKTTRLFNAQPNLTKHWRVNLGTYHVHLEPNEENTHWLCHIKDLQLFDTTSAGCGLKGTLITLPSTPQWSTVKHFWGWKWLGCPTVLPFGLTGCCHHGAINTCWPRFQMGAGCMWSSQFSKSFLKAVSQGI